MANIDIEDVGDELISLLQADLQTNLSAVESRKKVQYNPDPVAEYHFGEVSETPLMPSVIVAGDDATTVSDDMMRQQRYHYIIELNYDAEDVEKCRRIITRYGTAIDDTLRSDSAQTKVWASITNIGQRFSDTWTSREGGLYQTVQVSFDVIVFTD